VFIEFQVDRMQTKFCRSSLNRVEGLTGLMLVLAYLIAKTVISSLAIFIDMSNYFIHIQTNTQKVNSVILYILPCALFRFLGNHADK
jgi:hypothetical protein